MTKCWGAGRIRDKHCEISYIQTIIIWTLFRQNKTQIFGKRFAWMGTHPASYEWGWEPILKQQHQAGNCCLRGIGFKMAREHLFPPDHTFLTSENLHWVKGISSHMLKGFLRVGNCIPQAPQAHVLAPTWPQLYFFLAVLQLLSGAPQEHSAALLPLVQWQW